MEVFNGNELIRTLKSKAPEDNGIHRTYWYMDEKGTERMRRRDRNGSREPSGVTVLPGKYKVRIRYGDQMDSTTVKVEYDPRMELSSTAIRAKYQALKALEAKYNLGVKAVDRIKENIKIAKDIQRDLKDKDKEGFKEQIELTKSTIDTLNTMLDVFLGEEDDRQGITRGQPNSVNNFYFGATRYIENGLHTPGVTENKLMVKFEEELNKALDMVNGYYNEEWPSYREAVESLDTSPFKDYEEIKE